MTRLLLRCGKGRKAAWVRGNSVDDVIKTQFREPDGVLDLKASVYEVNDEHAIIVQTFAEHFAGIGLEPPPPGQIHIDARCADLSSVGIDDAPGDACFAHARGSHRELTFADEPALRRFVQEILASVETASRQTTRNEVLEYIRKQLQLGDSEWEEICRLRSGNKWAKYRESPKPPG